MLEVNVLRQILPQKLHERETRKAECSLGSHVKYRMNVCFVKSVGRDLSIASPVVGLPFGPPAVHLRADAKPLSCCCSPSREHHRPAEGCPPVTALSGALLCCISIKKKHKTSLSTAAPSFRGSRGCAGLEPASQRLYLICVRTLLKFQYFTPQTTLGECVIIKSRKVKRLKLGNAQAAFLWQPWFAYADALRDSL